MVACYSDVRRDTHSPRSMLGAFLLLAASQNQSIPVRPKPKPRAQSKLPPRPESMLRFSCVVEDAPATQAPTPAYSSLRQPCSTPARKRVLATLVTPSRMQGLAVPSPPRVPVPASVPLRATVVAPAPGIAKAELSDSTEDSLPPTPKRRRPADPAGIKQGWTKDEDALINACVEQSGPRWSTIAAMMPGRTDDAVRNRFLRLQRKRRLAAMSDEDCTVDIKTGDMWTPEEDRLVIAAANKHGLKWHLIAAAVPGRSVNAVRNRYLRCVAPAEAAAVAAASAAC